MKNSRGPLLSDSGFFTRDGSSELDYRQISRFFYDQMIDAFVLLRSNRPVDWNKTPSLNSRLKILADKFKIIEINDALALQSGKDSKALIGLSLGEFFGKQFKQNADAWNNLLEQGEVFSEFILQKNEDSLLWVEANYRMVKDNEGKTIGIIVVQRDVSQRKLAFIVNKEIEDNLRKLMHMSFQAIALLNQGKVMDTNFAMAKLTGYKQEELVNTRTLASCFPRQYAKTLFGKEWSEPAGVLETRLCRKDKKWIHVQIETQTISHQNKPLFVVGITDISYRKKIEEEIIKLSIALDQSSNAIIITHKNGEIEYVNRSFTKITGYLPSEAIGKNPRILKSGTHTRSFYKEL